MNKAEIIRKISKKAGVPDTEAKKFFEIFLNNTSDLLKPGESLNIRGVGLFQLRVGQIERTAPQDTGDRFIYSDIIVFIDEQGGGSEEAGEIIFNVPSGVEEQYQPVDSYFSLSIGKPVIPLKGLPESEFFIPPSGNELRGLLESKVEKLIEESEKVEGGKETETIHISTAEEGAGESFDWEKLWTEKESEETEVPSRSDFLKTREFENLSWDFGENLSEEIEGESVSDSGNEPEETEREEDVQIEEPGNIPEEKFDSTPLFEEETDYEDVRDEDIFEDFIDEETEETEKYGDKPVEAEESIPVGETGAKGEEITELKSETDKILDEEVEEREVREEKQFPPEPVPEDPVLKNFQRVRSLTKEFNSADFEETGEPEEEKPKKITEVRGGYQKVRRTTAEFNFDLSGIEGLDEIEETAPEEKKSVRREYRGYRKRSNLPALIIAFVVILALAVVIFLYMKMKSANNESASVDQLNAAKQQTTVIDRNYDVPVTYPYEKSGGQKDTGDKQDIKEQAGGKESSVNNAAPVEKKKEDLPEITEPVNGKRIGNYIYQYPEGIVVQLSSWKSRSIAINEVRKYRKAGYTAFAESSTIPGMGLYYRVRVGYFNSLQEAENFVNGK